MENLKKYSKKLNLDDLIEIGNSGFSVFYQNIIDRSDYDKNLLLNVNGRPTYFGKFIWVDYGTSGESQAINAELNFDGLNYKWEATRMINDVWDKEDFFECLTTRNKIGTNLSNIYNYLMNFTVDGNYNFIASKALQFYEDYVDHISYCDASGKDLGFDWDRCRAYCKVNGLYSKYRFMVYVANFFGTTVSEMKKQWVNIK